MKMFFHIENGDIPAIAVLVCQRVIGTYDMRRVLLGNEGMKSTVTVDGSEILHQLIL